MSVTHKIILICLDINRYWSTINLYLINVIFNHIIVLDEVYNMNSLKNQNWLKTGSKNASTIQLLFKIRFQISLVLNKNDCKYLHARLILLHKFWDSLKFLSMSSVMVEIWDEQPTIRIAHKLGVYLSKDLGYDLRNRTNITSRVEAAKNSSNVNMRLRRES